MRYLKTILCGLSIWALSTASRPAAAQEKEQPGVEILAKGPVHEGFATGVEQAPQPGPIVPKQPPEPVEELPPDSKPAGDNVTWIPGYWAWDEERTDFIWVSGFWRVPPPNRVWVPGGWRKSGNGWQWVGGFWNSIQQRQSEIQYFNAPPAPLDVGPATPAPAETSVYAPGCWMWRERWVWRPGYWIDYRPNHVWIPAHWHWTPGGYIFVDGYWDYPLADRGMLFAPVYYRAPVYLRPSYYYTPTVYVQPTVMFGAMFSRRGSGAYFFGDYFGATYVSAGYTSWCGTGLSVTVGYNRGYYDPNFAYYRATHRNDPFWNGGIYAAYSDRYRNPALRPAVTLNQQVNVVNNTRIINNTTIVNNNNPVLLASLRDAQKNPQMRMQSVPEAARQDQVRLARETQVVGRQRAVLETSIANTPVAKKEEVRRVRLEVPKQVAEKANTAPVAPPTIAKTPELVNPPVRTTNPSVAGKQDSKLPATLGPAITPKQSGTTTATPPLGNPMPLPKQGPPPALNSLPVPTAPPVVNPLPRTLPANNPPPTLPLPKTPPANNPPPTLPLPKQVSNPPVVNPPPPAPMPPAPKPPAVVLPAPRPSNPPATGTKPPVEKKDGGKSKDRYKP